ncbi:toxin-antitoxin system YwqK family antitoxin [Gaetbulibacter jejuensis]|uniref:Antitoxin component YwqK of YwqJK toxin-antitoxin module n=1 Tax=Gaetbulibacter jejuensis TaxID=584607 RepID=A0ABP3V647_9FLAO
MKKNLLLITTLLFTSIVSAQWTELVKMAEERNKPEEYYEYYENGNVKLKAFKDKDGNFNGMAIVYYENGNIQVKGNFVKDNFDGDVYFYNEEGVLTELKKFTLGTVNTKYVYFENGKIKSINNFENDLLNGEFKEFYESGKLKYHLYYKDNKHHGEGKTYYENGNLESKGNLIEGKQDGLWKYYYDNASLASEVVFKNGEIVSQKEYDRKEESNTNDYDDMFYWSDSYSSSNEDIDKAFKELTSVRNLQLVSIDEIKNNSGYFGSNNSTTHSFKIKTDESTRKLFASIRYEADKVYYEGRYYYDVLYDVQIIFDDVYEVYQNGDKIEFVFYEDYGFLRRAKPQGEYWSDYVKNEFNFSITIYDDDIREETLKNFKYLVENPIMKRE